MFDKFEHARMPGSPRVFRIPGVSCARYQLDLSYDFRRRYGVRSDQVIGSTVKLHYERRNGLSELLQLAQLDRLDEGATKPAAIMERLGRRPIAAFGNSDGDYEMLQYTTASRCRRLGILVHPDDADREYSYDRQSDMGRLDRGLSDAQTNGWKIVSIKNDWLRIFPDI
jgi:hypothetical protein